MASKVGNAARLRRYWERGEGAARIRWGTPGSFRRCVRIVGRHMTRVEGYCALRYKAVTGQWPGRKGRKR